MSLTSLIDSAALAGSTTVSYSMVTNEDGDLNKGGITTLGLSAATTIAANVDAQELEAQRVQTAKQYIASLSDEELEILLKSEGLLGNSQTEVETQHTK